MATNVNPASAAQIKYLAALGVNGAGMTMGAASFAIKARLAAGVKPAPLAARIAAPAAGGHYDRMRASAYASSAYRADRNAAALAAQTPIVAGPRYLDPVTGARTYYDVAPLRAAIAAILDAADDALDAYDARAAAIAVAAVSKRASVIAARPARYDAPGSALDDAAWLALGNGGGR